MIQTVDAIVDAIDIDKYFNAMIVYIAAINPWASFPRIYDFIDISDADIILRT